MNVHIDKHAPDTADGGSAMTSQSVGLIGLYKKNPYLIAFSVTTVSFISNLCVKKLTFKCGKCCANSPFQSVQRRTDNISDALSTVWYR